MIARHGNMARTTAIMTMAIMRTIMTATMTMRQATPRDGCLPARAQFSTMLPTFCAACAGRSISAIAEW